MVDVTPFGFFAILILTPLVLSVRRRTVVFATIFFILFETLGVVNIEIGKSFCLNTPQYLILLLSFVFFMGGLPKGRLLATEIGLPVRSLPIRIRLAIVLIIVSVLISFVAMGPTIVVFRREASAVFSERAVFAVRNVTQLVYLLFSIFAFTTLFKAFRLITAKEMAMTFVISVTFMAATAVFSLLFREETAAIYGVLMDNVSIGEKSMYSSVVSGQDSLGTWRISGLMREPGVLAQILLCGIVIMVIYIVHDGVLFGRRKDKLLVLFLSAVTVATMSSTIVVGVFGLSIALLLPPLITGKVRVSWFFRIAGFVFSVSLIIVALSITHILNPAHIVQYALAKLGLVKIEGIGISRLYDSKLMLDSFRQSPIFGCGYGSGFLGSGGLVTLLANVGVFGIIWFLLLFKETIFRKLSRLLRNLENPDYLALFAIRMATLNLLLIILVARNLGIGMYLPLWLLAAGSLGTFKVGYVEKKELVGE